MTTSETLVISFVIPCYREAPQTICKTVATITQVMDRKPHMSYEIILVNDGISPENVPQFQDPNIAWVHHSINKGYGASLMSGIHRARSPWIGIIDADATYPADHFGRLMECMDDHDMVVGQRNPRDLELMKRLPKYILRCLASFIADFKINDLNSGMRIFKKDIVLKYLKLFPQRFSFTTTITMICITNFYKVKFIDIPYYQRIGKSRIRPIHDTVQFFSLVLRLALYFKPLRFFMPLSGFIVLFAIARGVRDVIAVNHFGGLTLVLFFMAFQIFFFGLIAEIISKK